MTHGGNPQTFTSALPTLIKLATSDKQSMLRQVCGCRGAPLLHPPAPAARDIALLDWSHCPFDLLHSPFWSAVRRLDELASVAPLAGWPDRYAAWAVTGTIELRRLRA